MNEFRTAQQAAAAISAGQASSRELTEELLARIAAATSINAVVETRPEYALKAATAADEAVASGADLGPLHGVPMTIKDAINVAGLHTTWGDPAFADYVPDTSATLADRLAGAGAIIVGKSNVHTMLGDFGQTSNAIYGRTNNPYDVSRTPGGSSGGSAAALASGLTYLEYGSDLVGSIRLPAAYCGVYGLKPTAGLVPLDGFQPPGPTLPATEFPSISNVGPLARSAADLRTALQVTGGPVGKAMCWRLEPPRHRRLADYRVGYVLDHPDAPVTDEVGEALSDHLDALANQGVKLVEGWPDGVDPSAQAEDFGFQVGLFFALHGEGTDFASLAEILQQEHRRMAARATWQAYFADIDVFLCPTSFTTAFPHDDRPFDERTIDGRPYDAQVFWISHASLTGLPAVSMPIRSSGLPVGAQVISAFHEDDTAITFADLVADSLHP
ncbi:amidase [Kribbella qitaiheensis]|uniref:Amidase n=1 Tax=Kribbella qitaiheensis TaxID=1544730 RepID=A0A7G6X735_9ACTN|nr:amidase family protein [Kribbella qitaiheensis]QNE22050.1 amidase [Kribbella qitaiheensis]